MTQEGTDVVMLQKQTEEEAIKQLHLQLSGRSVEEQRAILTRRYHHGEPRVVRSYLEMQLNRSDKRPEEMGFADTGYFEVAMYDLSSGVSLFYDLTENGFEYSLTSIPPYHDPLGEEKQNLSEQKF